ncbi:MAG: glutamine--tRNA ligase/YqeY domain fusion protein [Myxococcota bacterium]
MSSTAPRDFIRQIIAEDVAQGRNDGRVVTRFPPEPNGFLHVGHAKHVVLNFELAKEFGGRCHLRFDDTNPLKEEQRFADQMMKDIRWLGYDWGEHLYHASDYFPKLYELAQHAIREGLAYVCSLDEASIREWRGTVTSPGRPSPNRDRDSEESLRLLEEMRNGKHAEGAFTLRAKIDMASPNMKLRDPLMYRIRKAHHHKTADAWSIYPMYDYAHPVSDALEMVTHSLCTLEFENNRAVYDWFVEKLPLPSRPRQIEYARLNLAHTLMSKRKLKSLVDEGIVADWDDPRMPTVAALRRRGYTPSALRGFATRAGVSRADNVIEYAALEYSIREELNRTARRVMAVLDPVELVITNYPEGHGESITAVNNPEDAEAGTREVPFSGRLFIERGDFMEDAPKKWFRMAPGREVRLKHAYFVTCEEVVKNEAGEVIQLRCSYDPESRGGDSPDGRRVKGTLHWVDADRGIPADVRLYDQLFEANDPGGLEDLLADLRPDSLQLRQAIVEPSLAELTPETTVQFMRLGYFSVDQDSTKDRPVFNRTVGLKDSWSKEKKKS